LICDEVGAVLCRASCAGARGAPYLILTNTTFGYWGAYIGELLAQKLVLSPDIHQVISEDARIYQSRPKMHRTHWVAVHHPEGKNWITGEML